MKKLVCLTLASLVSLSAVFAQADHHSAGPLFYGQSIGLVASDAPAVLSAMDKWRNSEAGKSAPNTVVLLQNIVNGEYKSTHGINIFYPNGASIDASMKLYAGNKDWADFEKTLSSLVEPEWENTYSMRDDIKGMLKEDDEFVDWAKAFIHEKECCFNDDGIIYPIDSFFVDPKMSKCGVHPQQRNRQMCILFPLCFLIFNSICSGNNFFICSRPIAAIISIM